MKSKKLVDIITVLLLACAFGLAFYTGLVGQKANGEYMLNTGTFCLISVLGSLVLMAVGGASEMIARVKNNHVTWSATAFMAVQVFAFIGMCAVAIAVKTGAFDESSALIRVLFIVFALIELLGYVQAVLYTGGIEEKEAPAAQPVYAGETETAETDSEPEEYEYYYTDEDSEEFDGEFGEEFAKEFAEEFFGEDDGDFDNM